MAYICNYRDTHTYNKGQVTRRKPFKLKKKMGKMLQQVPSLKISKGSTGT